MLKREIPGWLAGACLLLSVALAAPAQANLTLAQIAPMSGPIAEEGRAYNLGIRVAIEAQNARGGLHGLRHGAQVAHAIVHHRHGFYY